MKYLCLVYLDDPHATGPAGSGSDALSAEVIDYQNVLRERGYAVVSSSVQPADTATTIRVRNGRILMEDGPHGEANQHLDGVYLIEAGDLNDAIRIVSRIPTARLGNIEIRPVRDLDLAQAPQARLTGKLHP